MRTLVIHPGKLGEVIQTVPAIRALRAEGPVVWTGQPRFGELLLWLGEVDETREVDLQAIFEGGPAPEGYDRIVSWAGASHVAYCWALRAAASNVITDTAPIVGPTGDGDRRPLRVPTAGPREDFTLVQPGSYRRWRIPRPKALAAAMPSGSLVVHQGPGDGEAVTAFLVPLARSFTHLFEPTLPMLAQWCARAARCVGGDTGVTQLAAALGTPTTILHTDALARRWAPWCQT